MKIKGETQVAHMFKFLIISIILLFAVPGFPANGQEDYNVNWLKELKACINDIINSHVTQLEKESGKAAILKRLRDAKSNFEQCGIANNDPNKEEVLETLDKYITEAEKFEVREQYPEKSQEYSEKLREKFSYVIQLIDKQIEGNGEKSDKKEEIPGPGQKEKSQDKKQQVISKENLPFRQQGDYKPYIFLSLILLGILFGLIYFFIYKKIRKNIEEKSELFQRKLIEVKDNLHKSISHAEENLSTKIGEVDGKLKQLILQLKYMDDDRLDDMKRSPTPPPAESFDKPGTGIQSGQEIEGLQVLEEEQKIPGKPGIAIDFPVTSFRETWKNKILHEFKKNHDKMIEFGKRTGKLEEFKEWFRIVGRRLQAYPQDTEKTFFINIYPGIKTLQSKLARQEIDEFKEIFFKAFLDTLEIEEFGQIGEQFNPGKHSAYVKEVDKKGGEMYFIKKVDYPGYKMKYTSEILQKAYVVL